MRNAVIRMLALILILFMFQGRSYAAEADLHLKRQLSASEEFLRSGEIIRGVKLLEELAVTHSKNAEVHFRLGSIQVYLLADTNNGIIPIGHSSKKALKHLELASSLAPDNLVYLAKYAGVASDIEEDEIAIHNFEKLFSFSGVRSNPVYSPMVINYFFSLNRLGYADKGLYELKTTLEETGYDMRISVGFIGALALIKDIDAIRQFREKYREIKGTSGIVEYSVCYEFAAAQKYRLASDCFAEMMVNNALTYDLRHKAKLELKKIETIMGRK